MKLIEQSHEILSISPNILQTIERAGRTCYKSEGKITPDSAEKFVSMLIKKGHHAMIEFGDITVKFITNRGVTHELVRHRLCSIANESTRYVKYDGEMEFILPVWMGKDYLGVWDRERVLSILTCEPVEFIVICDLAEDGYKSLIKHNNWQPQQAREVLPNALKTEIVVKANVREWRHIFKLRCSKKAHPQMVALMTPLLEELKTKIPVVFDDITV